MRCDGTGRLSGLLVMHLLGSPAEPYLSENRSDSCDGSFPIFLFPPIVSRHVFRCTVRSDRDIPSCLGCSNGVERR